MDGMIIFYLIFGFFSFCLITFASVIWVLWNRRKLIVTNFLGDNGQWSKEFWKPQEIHSTFLYDEETYKYDINNCTRDSWNRPIAHYYKGNPEQQQFDYKQINKKLIINTQELTQKDFTVLMLSKVLRDIFADDEVMRMLMIILIVVIFMGVIIAILIFARNPPCTLKDNNATIDLIARGCKMAIMNVPR